MDDKKQTNASEQENTPVPAIVDERTIREKIYLIRGQQVMLDSDLAAIYGYTTSAFNQQVKRNADRFPADFRFQLSKEDLEALSRSQNVILNRGTGRGANIKYMPYAYNEQGIYMLMTVLKGELAVQQSIPRTKNRHFIDYSWKEVENSIEQAEHLGPGRSVKGIATNRESPHTLEDDFDNQRGGGVQQYRHQQD